MKALLAALGLLLLPAAAGARVSPTAPAHPGLPWALGPAITTGQLIRYVWVAPQAVVVDTLVPVAGEENGEPQTGVLRQTFTVPGYWARETTAGVYHPERWVLEQVAPGAFRWRLAPPEVRGR